MAMDAQRCRGRIATEDDPEALGDDRVATGHCEGTGRHLEVIPGQYFNQLSLTTARSSGALERHYEILNEQKHPWPLVGPQGTPRAGLVKPAISGIASACASGLGRSLSMG